MSEFKCCRMHEINAEETRLDVLEREHKEFFDRWHEERRKREKWQQIVCAAAELVCSPAWRGFGSAGVKLEKALIYAGLVQHNDIDLKG